MRFNLPAGTIKKFRDRSAWLANRYSSACQYNHGWLDPTAILDLVSLAGHARKNWWRAPAVLKITITGGIGVWKKSTTTIFLMAAMADTATSAAP
jgi:hypothetical protein